MCSLEILPCSISCPSCCNQGAKAPPRYVVASVSERQEAVLSLTECQGAWGSQKFIKTRGRPAPVKTRMDAEDTPEDQATLIDQDRLEGQAQSQMLPPCPWRSSLPSTWVSPSAQPISSTSSSPSSSTSEKDSYSSSLQALSVFISKDTVNI